MKRTRVKSIVTLLALATVVLLTGCALATGRPGLANGFQSTAAVTARQPAGAFLTINPVAGFPLDPFLVSVQGGGPLDASMLAAKCTGYVAAAPTVSIVFQGQADVLRAFFFSDGDTTLVVRTPDGGYLCGDDTNALILDPTVEIGRPITGTYDVWVGSAVATDLIPGFLAFTTRGDLDARGIELTGLVKRPGLPAFIPLRQRLVTAAQRLEQADAAVQAAAALVAGGAPVVQEFTATGELPAVELQTGQTLCGGLVNITPDYAFDWTGETEALNLFVEATGDTTLLVRAPDGSFLCADDADGMRNLNPLLAIPAPFAGRYLVWIGRVAPDEPVTGRLMLSEAADAMPTPLTKQ